MTEPGGKCGDAEQADEADEARGQPVRQAEVPPCAPRGQTDGHRFAADPRCTADNSGVRGEYTPEVTDGTSGENEDVADFVWRAQSPDLEGKNCSARLGACGSHFDSNTDYDWHLRSHEKLEDMDRRVLVGLMDNAVYGCVTNHHGHGDERHGEWHNRRSGAS